MLTRLAPLCSAYNTSAGSTFTTTATTLQLQAMHVDLPGYTLTSNEVTPPVAGFYRLGWATTLKAAGSNSRTSAESWVEEGGSEIPGTRSVHYCRQTNYGDTGGGCIVVQLDGSAIRLRGRRIVGGANVTQIVNGNRLFLELLAPLS